MISETRKEKEGGALSPRHLVYPLPASSRHFKGPSLSFLGISCVGLIKLYLTS